MGRVRTVSCLLLFLSSVLSLQSSFKGSILPVSKISVNNTRPGHPFVDKDGRARIFHGINKVEKQPPWYAADLTNDTYLDLISSWGFNVVRLGMMWSGVEIAPFQINQTYLDTMDGIIKSLSKRGVYVILDMHQDGLSSKFGMYDGAPRWLVDTLPAPAAEDRYPAPFTKPPSSWGWNYVTIECGEAFEKIYTNQSAALDHLGFFWQTVAKRFGSYDNVLGYEIINEPWPGNVLLDPELFLPGHPGSTFLQPMYDKIADFIRRVDKKTMIFYEPVTWGMILHDDTLGTGFTSVPGGNDYRDRSVLSFHYYCWFAGSDSDSPFPLWLRILCDGLFFPEVLSSIHKDIDQTGGGKFLTEFGLCKGDAPHNSTEYGECLSVLTTADSASVSWTYWDSIFFSGGSVILPNVLLFSRTYAMAVAGDSVTSSFDTNTGTFTLKYIPSKDTASPTVIYASPLHYPHGLLVKASNASYIINSPYIEVVSSDPTPAEIVVIVTRKSNT